MIISILFKRYYRCLTLTSSEELVGNAHIDCSADRLAKLDSQVHSPKPPMEQVEGRVALNYLVSVHFINSTPDCNNAN